MEPEIDSAGGFQNLPWNYVEVVIGVEVGFEVGVEVEVVFPQCSLPTNHYVFSFSFQFFLVLSF